MGGTLIQTGVRRPRAGRRRNPAPGRSLYRSVHDRAASLPSSIAAEAARRAPPPADARKGFVAMPDPLPNPIKILVKGASTVGWLGVMGGPRTDFGFPRAMEEALLQSGRPVELRTLSVPSERTKTAVRRWEHEMIGFSPDVVVLVYGHYETVHLFLPWWLERHANSRVVPPRGWSTVYRRRLLWPLWMMLAKLQSRLDTKVDPAIRSGRPKKVVADLEKIISHTQELQSPLVLLWQYTPPAKRYRSWFPGMARRIEIMNQ